MTLHGTVSIARALSKLGHSSRAEGERLVAAGRVRVDGVLVRDANRRVVPETAVIEVDGARIEKIGPVYVALNKPRGLVTTRRDPQDRGTVYDCLAGSDLPFVGPVGRLDKASEGLLLFSNDPRWAARITDALTGPCKTYHVQIDTRPDAALLSRLVSGIEIDGEPLTAESAQLLRAGEKNSWLEIVLTEGRNRHIRRLLEAHDIAVLRLLRVAIGGLELGNLAKGQWRWLDSGDLGRLGVGMPDTG